MSSAQNQLDPQRSHYSLRLLLFSSAAVVVGSAVVFYLYYHRNRSPPIDVLQSQSDGVDTEAVAEVADTDELIESQSDLRIKRAMSGVFQSPANHHSDIHSVIANQYSADTESDDSSLDSDEQREIVRMKTLERPPNHISTPSNLFRPTSNTEWDADRIDAEYNTLLIELAQMREHDVDSDEEPVPADPALLMATKSLPIRKAPKMTSKMFRMKSAYKWDSDQVDHQKKEMQEQMAHLLRTELAAGSSLGSGAEGK